MWQESGGVVLFKPSICVIIIAVGVFFFHCGGTNVVKRHSHSPTKTGRVIRFIQRNKLLIISMQERDIAD